MLPITSYSRIQANPGAKAGCFQFNKTGYRQKKPYTLNLAYSTWNVRTTSVTTGYTTPTWSNPNASTTGVGTVGCTAFSHVNGFAQNTSYAKMNALISEVQNTARERFIGTMKGSASLAVSLAEGRQAMDMMSKRIYQVYDFARALRKGRIPQAAKILGVQKHPLYSRLVKDMTVRGQLRAQGFKKRLKLTNRYKKRLISDKDNEQAGLFLEFHFGWSPLVGDIYDSMDVLQRDIPSGCIVGRAKGSLDDVVLTNSPANTFYTSTHKVNVNVVVGAKVGISNPNLALANQLGVINPAVVVWSLMPWSFVVDWFANVGAFLESFTDTAGYTITDPFTRIFSEDLMSHQLISGGNLAYRYSMVGWSANRVLTLPGVVLKTKDSWRLSPTRALTAISLLMQLGYKSV